ncbi:TOM (translocase of outer membrane) complex component [Steccherinum ochraceum]|uniref:TOM (Translocase of outer membrane) complex component n=1 Tax=Steccherinum ochraceum TaxID=92696 RepID=A0A4R0RSV0_9APHY|nr:TOM (translocase of outer membrane) complex component [Steccherinum ochraceum]
MSASTSSDGVVERVQNFVAENKRAVLLGAALTVAAIGGVAYYASTSRRSDDGDPEKGDRKKKKASKSSKKTKSGKDEDGPLLEEAKPKTADEEPLTEEQIAAMSTEERKNAAASLKGLGNTAYQKHDFSRAVDLYTRAIAVSPAPEPVFYSNRAACYMNMKPPVYESVVRDCDSALELDNRYIKSLLRRATALEQLERYEDALRDFTTATILEQFRNDNASQSVERVLKKLATQKGQEILATREPRLPSHTFVSAYFGAFRTRALPTLPENPTTGDQNLLSAVQALAACDYAHSFSLINEALDQGLSNKTLEAEAYNLRGTFKFLFGDVPGAKADLQASLDLVPSLTQSLVKLASVHMEQGDPQQAFECFEEAIKQNSEDPDIYYHRGQGKHFSTSILFIMNEFDQAAENYTKSTELDDQFVFSHIQLAVAQYKSGHVANSMATFRRTLKQFPERSEPFNYYGELLLDSQRYADALEKFDKAIEIEKQKTPPPPINVLPLVNKGLALYQQSGKPELAQQHCEEALELDAECEAAVATLAQLHLQQQQLVKATEMFKRQADLARSEPELVNALTYQFATGAQIEFVKNYPDMMPQLGQIARGMMMQ